MELRNEPDALVVAGQVDGRCLAELRDAIDERLVKDPDLVLDLSGVESVDLTSLRMIAVASRRAQQQGHRLQLRGCSPLLRRLLHLTRLRTMVLLDTSSTSH